VAKDQTDWKQKYKEAARELERLEGNRSDEYLRLALSQMTLGLQGQSEALDDALQQTRKEMQSSSGLSKASVGLLEKEIRSIDQANHEASDALLKAVQEWALTLKRVCKGDQQAALILLEREAEAATESLYALPDWVSRMVAFQKGLNLSPLPANLFDEGDESPAETTKPTAASESPVSWEGVISELQQLVEALELNNGEAAKLASLQNSIKQIDSMDRLISVLVDLIAQVQAASIAAHKDFEQYLVNLNTQLSAVQSYLTDNQKDDALLIEAHKALDEQVRTEVQNIHSAVSTSNDLTDLKSTVSTQLNTIVSAMDEFRKNEEAREQRSQQRHDELMQQMRAMEEESRRVKAHMEAERLKARTDALTGLPNRAAYDDHLNKEFQRWVRYQQSFSVAVGDLDFFKSINDNYGHLAGDKVLRLVARVLSKSLRASDFIARFGGEEFVILLPSTEADTAVTVIDKLRSRISESPFNFHGKPVKITMSFGVAETQDNDNVEQLFERADKALYQAKNNGRDQVCRA
jgi:diguanylate cyclase